jgi:6-phosphogluconolactonase (cycloisomerase 2 family)
MNGKGFNPPFAIEIFAISPTTGTLGPPTAVPVGAPFSSFAATPSGKYIYTSVAENFTVDPKNGALTQIANSGYGVVASYIAIDTRGKFLYAADASNPGNVAGLSIDSSTGALTAVPGSPFPIGNSGNASLAIDPGAKFLFAGNAGGGISVFSIDSTSGALSPVPGSPFQTIFPGSPDKIIVHPNGKFLYATLNGPGETIEASFAVASDGSLSPTPNSWGPDGTLAESAVIDPGGKFLYTALTNDFAIAGYAVDQTSGSLTVLGFYSGVDPWDLVVDPSGQFLYVSDLASPGIVTLRIAPGGALAQVGQPALVKAGTVPLGVGLVQVQ